MVLRSNSFLYFHSFIIHKEALESCKMFLISVKEIVFCAKSESELCGETVYLQSSGTVITRCCCSNSVEGGEVYKKYFTGSHHEKNSILYLREEMQVSVVSTRGISIGD